MDNYFDLKYIDLIVQYGPTLLFVLIMLVSTLTGFIRGFRKSLILAIHALISAIICIILFFVFTKVDAVGTFLLFVIDFIMGGTGALANMLGVSHDVTTLKEVIVYAIPNFISFGGQIDFIIIDNLNYFATLVDVVYNLVFAIVCIVIYEFLIGLLNIIYHLFYSERKYKKRRKKAFADSKVDSTYKKKRLLGSLVGLSRGIVAGILSLSILGNTLFVLVGPGKGESEDIDFGNDTINYIYDVYQSVESYGTTGIYKVLNSFTDSKDQPYYLFAMDLVFSGRLVDQDLGIDENIRFTDEMEAYTGLIRDTANLLLKYGGDELVGYLMGRNDITIDFLISVMLDPNFQNEFESLIIDFDSKTYFINFAFSFVDSFISSMGSLGLGEIPDEMISILFKKGFLSDKIPDERELKLSQKQNANNVSEEEEEVIPPYIHIGHLLKKQDILTAYDVIKEFVEFAFNPLPDGVVTDEDQYIYLAKTLIPYLSKLSILDTRRASELDPVFGRLYCYLENVLLTVEGKDGITYNEIADDNIHWIEELNSLLSTVPSLIGLYQNIVPFLNDPSEIIASIFDVEHESYNKNQEYYQVVRNAISNSRILGKVLSSNMVVETIIITLGSAFGGETYIPDYIRFENTYDFDGNLLEYGELHLLLGGIEILGKPENYSILYKLLNNANSVDVEFITSILSILESTDNYGFTLLDYLSESNLLRSVISSVLISFANTEGVPLYISDRVKEKDLDGEVLPLIDKATFKSTITLLSELVPLVEPFISNPSMTQEELLEEMELLMKNPKTKELLTKQNYIVEGSIAKLLITYLGNTGLVIIPESLKTPEGWLTSNNTGELNAILNFVFESEVSLFDFLSMEEGSNPLDMIKDFTTKDVERLFESKVLHYTISNIIDSSGDIVAGDFKLIIPKSTKVVLTDDSLDYVIAKEQLVSIFSVLIELDLENLSEPTAVLSQLINHKDAILSNDIVSASIVNFLVNNESTKELLFKNAAEDDKYIIAAKPKNLETYAHDNPWRQELVYLMDSLDEIFGISLGHSIDLTEEGLNSKIDELMSTINDGSQISPSSTRLTVCCRSRIVRGLMTETLDSAFASLVSADVLKKAKASEGCYTLKELEALAACLDILDVNGDFNSIDPNDITAIVLTLNDTYKGNQTKLDAIYNSIIIQHIVSDRLDEALVDGGLVDANIIVSIKKNGVYPKVEVASILNGIITLCGKDTTSLEDLADIEFDLTNINKNIDVIANSAIIRSIVSVKLDEAIVGNNYSQELADAIKEKDGSKPLYYSKTELVALVHALNTILVTKDNPNPSLEDIANFNFDLNTIKENLDVISESCIIRAIVSAELDKIIVDSGYDLKQFTKLKEYTLSDKSKVVYKKVELISFFTALEELVDLSSSNSISINADDILSMSDDVFINKVYASNIFAIIITNELDKVLTEDLINPNVLDTIKSNNRYEANEITRMIKAIKLLSDDPDNFSFEDISSIDVTEDYDKFETNLPEIYNSDIVAGIITKQLNKVLVSNGFKDHPYAYETDGIYRRVEIEALLDLDLLDFKGEIYDIIDSISSKMYNDEGKTESYLLVATVSDTVINRASFLVIPQKSTEKGFIKPEELNKLLSSLDALNIDLNSSNGNDILNTLPDENAYGVIFSSNIVRASITSLIKSSSDSDISTLYIAKEKVDSKGNVTETLVTKDKNIKTGKSIIILSSNELIRIFDILQCCSTDGSISIPSINGVAGVISFINKINATDGTSFDEIYDCSLFRHLISDIIDKNLTDTIKLALSFKNIEIKYSSESVYQLSPVQQSSTQTKKYIELKSLKSIFDVYDTLM